MKRILLSSLLICNLSILSCLAQIKNYNRNLIRSNISKKKLSSSILDIQYWFKYPTYQNRKAWSGISSEIIKKHLSDGDEALKDSWEIPENLRSQFKINGNRVNFESRYLQRRKNLQNLFLAEMVSGKGKYLPAIVQGIDAILSENQWFLPAHDNTEVDLYVGETSNLLARINILLGKEIESQKNGTSERIRQTIKDRFLIPAFERDFLWKGNNDSKKLNNWTPWIVSNWIECCLLVESDEDKKIDGLYCAITCLDKFLNQYPEDGGCEEGPGYWFRNGGATFEALDILYRATKGEINLFKNPLIKNIAAYISKSYISGSYYVNFGDSNARPTVNIDLLYRFGLRTEDSTLVKFASYLAKYSRYKGYEGGLSGIFTYDKVLMIPPKAPYLSNVALPNIEVYSSRSISNSNRGFYFAAKGGNNGESHNHNDVGNFIVYYNGYPVIIDVGVEAYTKASFDKDMRYGIWTMQSQYHTLPTINDTQQQQGSQFAAKNAGLTIDKHKTIFKTDISGAYSKAAGVKSWERIVTLNKGESGSIDVIENYSLNIKKGTTFLSFVTSCKVEVDKNGIIKLKFVEKGENISVKIVYDATNFRIETEKISLKDAKLIKTWGDTLTRIRLIVLSEKNEDQLKYSFVH